MFALAQLLAFAPLLAETRLWYAAPLIVSVSLVFSATRHEEAHDILSHALRFGGWVLVFMGLVTAAMLLMGWLQ